VVRAGSVGTSEPRAPIVGDDDRTNARTPEALIRTNRLPADARAIVVEALAEALVQVVGRELRDELAGMVGSRSGTDRNVEKCAPCKSARDVEAGARKTLAKPGVFTLQTLTLPLHSGIP
jgi:hypothetical protein